MFKVEVEIYFHFYRAGVESMTRILTVANHKGGVGKTTTALNLAAGLALRLRRTHPTKLGRVLLLDLDPTAAALLSICFEAYSAEPANSLYALLAQTPPPSPQRLIRRSAYHDNLFFIPTNPEAIDLLIRDKFSSLVNREARLARALRPVQNDYEYIIIDTPPTTGYMLDNALVASTHVIIPVELTYLGTLGLVKIEESIEKIRQEFEKDLPIAGYVPSMVDKNQSEPQALLEMLEARYPGKVLQPIHRSVDIKYAHSAHMDVFSYMPGRQGAEQMGSISRPATREFAVLVDQVVSHTQPR